MKKNNILIVDDRPDNILSLKAMLDGLDINIISAYSGNEALTLLLEYDVALVLLDVQMPETDGFEVAELIRARKKTRAIPIILITAISQDQKHIFKGYESGAVDYIFKPIEQPWIIRHKVMVFCALYEARRQAQEAIKTLRLSEKQWQLTFDAIGDLVSIHDTNFRVLRINRATANFFQQEPTELVGRKCFEIFCSHNRECQNCPIIALEQDLRPHTAEISHRKLKKTFQVSAFPIFDEEQNFIGVIHIAKDITDRKNLENQLRQAQKMEAIGTLASGIAHDFNNILTPIIGHAELLRLKAAPDSTMKKGLDIILQSAGRATQLVKQILSFSRQKNQEMVTVTIQPIIKETLKLLRSSLPTTIEIRQEIDIHCGPIMADPTQIHQLLMNLCTNSGHAMADHGGVLGITLRCSDLTAEDCSKYPALSPGPYLNLEISDSGCGMEQDVLERIFEPYFTTKKKDQGTGMGLAVVHGIVTTHKGHISVYSDPGQGTTFRILLPIARTDVITIEETKSDALLPTGTEHILMVDDEQLVVEVNREILSALGYQVTSETSSAKALELFRTHKNDFDLVITDLTMPELTGVELTKELLKLRPEIPVILCTGFSELIDAEEAHDLGIREFIYKPVGIEDMAVIVRRVLENK